MAPNALKARLAKVAQAVDARTASDRYSIVEAITVAHAGGLSPGLYPSRIPGSSTGVLVYDPAHGPPAVPDDRMAPWGKLIVSEGATIASVS